MSDFKKVLALFTIVGLIVYAGILHADFVLDDSFAVLDNPAIQSLKNIGFIWQKFNTRFIVGLSLAVNYAVGAVNPFGYHLLNVIIHVAASALVFSLTRLIFKTPYLMDKPFSKKEGGRIALFSGLIFLLHPLQTESVSYIYQRAVSLATLFYLSALVLYLKSRLQNNPVFFKGALLTTFLGMLTKEMTATIPAAVCILEILFFQNKKQDFRKMAGRIIPFFLALLIIPAALYFESPYSALNLNSQILTSDFKVTNFLTEINALRTYLGLFIFPVNQNLDHDYPFAGGLLEISTIASLALLMGLGFMAIFLFKRERIISFCIAWFFVTTSVEFVTCSLVGRDMLVEHYLYLPMVGYALFLSFVVVKVLKENRKINAILFIIVALLAGATVHRNDIWADTERLIKDTITKSPRKLRPRYMLTEYYVRKGKLDQAEKTAMEAIALDPKNPVSLYNLGMIYEAKGNPGAARKQYEDAIRLDPFLTPADAYFKLGHIYQRANDLEKAESFYQASIEKDSKSISAYCNLANMYMTQKKYDEAIALYQETIKINPLYIFGHSGLAAALIMRGDYDGGIKEYEKIIAIDPQNAAAYKNLGKTYSLMKNLPAAKDFFEKTIAVNPKDVEAYQRLADIYDGLNQPAKARETIKIAIRLLKESGQEDLAKQLQKQHSTEN